MTLGSILTLIGFTVMAHCAWGVSSCEWFLLPLPCRLPAAALMHPPTHCWLFVGAADRDMLKLTQQEFTGLPQQLHLELLASVALCLAGEGRGQLVGACLCATGRVPNLPLWCCLGL